MASTLLFLIGGSDGDILDRVADEFVPAAGGPDAAIALLMIGGDGWQSHVPQYGKPWASRGATTHHVIVPGDDGMLDTNAAIRRLEEATGIFIAGGPTAGYHRLYATEPIRSAIRRRYFEGVPVAGLSAGAMISPDYCLLRPSKHVPTQPFQIVTGLGLLGDIIVEVHFSEGSGRLPSLLEGMTRTRVSSGLGIDSSACAVFENGRLARVLGRSVHEVTMTDFEASSYQVREVRDRGVGGPRAQAR